MENNLNDNVFIIQDTELDELPILNTDINECKKIINDNNDIVKNAINKINKNIDLIQTKQIKNNQIKELKSLLNKSKQITRQFNKNIIKNNLDIIDLFDGKYELKNLNNENSDKKNKRHKKRDKNIIKNEPILPEIGVSIVIAVYSKDTKLYIGCHFDNTETRNRFGKISACGGHVDEGESYIDAAVREAQEEHGLIIKDETKLEFISENVNKKSGKRSKYYGVDVTPEDYSTKDVLTPHEVMCDLNYIDNVFSKFPENSIINTGAQSTFFIDLDALTSFKNSKYIYMPFYNFLCDLKKNKN